MRKYFILFLAVNVTSLYALIGGAGINIVQDQFTIDEKLDGEYGLNEFTTSGINNPVGVGGFMYLTIIPFVDFELGYNATFQTYDLEINLLETNLLDETIAIGKLTWYASAQYPFFSPPTMRFYIGAGANGTNCAEPVTAEILTELALTGDDTEPSAILDAVSKSSSGYHVELGARLKPPLFPMSLNANARYIMDKDFHSDVDGYLMVSLGVAFAI